MSTSRYPRLVVRSSIRADGLLFKRVILFGWATYLSLVATTNLTDALKAAGATDSSFAFASENWDFMVNVTSIYRTPTWVNAIVSALALRLLPADRESPSAPPELTQDHRP